MEQTFEETFKREAVRLVQKSLQQIAEDLKMEVSTLSRWCTELADQQQTRLPFVGAIVHFVDEATGDYKDHIHLPALVQYVYETGSEGNVHLHIYEADPRDTHCTDAFYDDEEKKPGTWH